MIYLKTYYTPNVFSFNIFLLVHYVKTFVNSPQTISYTSVFINEAFCSHKWTDGSLKQTGNPQTFFPRILLYLSYLMTYQNKTKCGVGRP